MKRTLRRVGRGHGAQLLLAAAVGLLGGAGVEASAPWPELKWIPKEARAVFGFDSERSTSPALFTRLQDEILFGAGLGEPLQQFLTRTELHPARDLRRVVIAVVPLADGKEGVLGIATTAPASSRITVNLRGEAGLTPLDENTLAFGDGASRAPLRSILEEARLTKLVEEAREGAQAWGVLLPEWAPLHFASAEFPDIGGRSLGRSLAGIDWVTLSASVSSEVRLRVRTRVRDEADTVLLADALRWFVASFAGESNPSAEVRQAMREARISVASSTVTLSIPFTEEALDRVRHNEASRRLLTWRLGPEGREARQNIPAIVRALDIGEGARVADVGAGDGFFTVRLSFAVGASGRVVAVEIKETLVSELKERFRAASLGNVDAVLGGVDDPHLAPESLDAALIVNTYHEMSHQKPMLERLREALKPEGRLVLVEPYLPERRGESRESQASRHRIAPELVEEDLRAAGFEVVTRVDALTEPEESGRLDSLVAGRRPR